MAEEPQTEQLSEGDQDIDSGRFAAARSDSYAHW